jgi:enamine deaminase RidA (YjgF/YER057c/UK114 family)
MPREEQYGYAQPVKVDDAIYVSGQLSHDDRGNMVGAAPLDDSGRIRDYSNMEAQTRQRYANAKKRLISSALRSTTSSRRCCTSETWTPRSP